VKERIWNPRERKGEGKVIESMTVNVSDILQFVKSEKWRGYREKRKG